MALSNTHQINEQVLEACRAHYPRATEPRVRGELQEVLPHAGHRVGAPQALVGLNWHDSLLTLPKEKVDNIIAQQKGMIALAGCTG